jgi:hypothetical protein
MNHLAELIAAVADPISTRRLVIWLAGIWPAPGLDSVTSRPGEAGLAIEGQVSDGVGGALIQIAVIVDANGWPLQVQVHSSGRAVEPRAISQALIPETVQVVEGDLRLVVDRPDLIGDVLTLVDDRRLRAGREPWLVGAARIPNALLEARAVVAVESRRLQGGDPVGPLVHALAALAPGLPGVYRPDMLRLVADGREWMLELEATLRAALADLDPERVEAIVGAVDPDRRGEYLAAIHDTGHRMPHRHVALLADLAVAVRHGEQALAEQAELEGRLIGRLLSLVRLGIVVDGHELHYGSDRTADTETFTVRGPSGDWSRISGMGGIAGTLLVVAVHYGLPEARALNDRHPDAWPPQ